MNIKRSIKFSLNNRSSKVIEIPIRVRITYNGSRYDYPIGLNIDLNKWDNTNEKAKGTNSISVNINKTIADIRDKVNKLFIRYEIDEILPTKEQLQNDLQLLLSKKKNTSNKTLNKEYSFFDRYNEFTTEGGNLNSWSIGTQKKFTSLKNNLYDFNPKLNINEFNSESITSFLSFLQDVKKHRNNTLKKDLGLLKWFLRWADLKGYSSERAYTNYNYKPKGKENNPIIFLDWEELQHLYKLEIPSNKQYLERVRDVFCFCCYTSLRYSDVYNLRRSDITDNTIEIVTIKTNDKLSIDLNNYSKTILDKYKDIHFEDNKALPVISNQKMNDYLKELGELAGFDNPIRHVYFIGNERKEEVHPKYALLCTHAGRRTFICNALALGIPAQVVMKWTGHNDYKAMKPYIEVAEKTKKEAMELFNLK